MPPAAEAELIDNALGACTGRTKEPIEVRLHFESIDGADELKAISVRDHGKGDKLHFYTNTGKFGKGYTDLCFSRLEQQYDKEVPYEAIIESGGGNLPEERGLRALAQSVYDDQTSGTLVVISDLKEIPKQHLKLDDIGKTAEYLREAYYMYLGSGARRLVDRHNKACDEEINRRSTGGWLRLENYSSIELIGVKDSIDFCTYKLHEDPLVPPTHMPATQRSGAMVDTDTEADSSDDEEHQCVTSADDNTTAAAHSSPGGGSAATLAGSVHGVVPMPECAIDQLLTYSQGPGFPFRCVLSEQDRHALNMGDDTSKFPLSEICGMLFYLPCNHGIEMSTKLTCWHRVRRVEHRENADTKPVQQEQRILCFWKGRAELGRSVEKARVYGVLFLPRSAQPDPLKNTLNGAVLDFLKTAQEGTHAGGWPLAPIADQILLVKAYEEWLKTCAW
ncbi:hypothetical protein JKP88DRAFT_276233 [Tribonema minus]|uniref:Uncharacterized protein n=1 Tax=Tribonema minus TaxID=303371 RepID=A0A835Z696_9STRA|nr:hypothetical protein JKP88DRAFT_276233 [Tribonema minus]